MNECRIFQYDPESRLTSDVDQLKAIQCLLDGGWRITQMTALHIATAHRDRAIAPVLIIFERALSLSDDA